MAQPLRTPAMPEPHEQGRKGQIMTCALRALTLCDGQVLEDPEGHPTECLCVRLRRAEDGLSPRVAADVRAQLQGLIERTLAAPQLPL